MKEHLKRLFLDYSTLNKYQMPVHKNINIKTVTVIIVVSLFLGIFYNSLSPSGLDFIRKYIDLEYTSVNVENNISDEAPLTDKQKKEPSLITIDDAYKLFQSNNAVFIDARDQWDFQEGHIKSAISIPEYKYSSDMLTVKALNRNFYYVVYCGDIECDVSKRLAIELAKEGFNNVFILEGGWTTWNEKQYPVEN